MPIKYSNNANTTLASGITAAATSLSVAAGTGAKFPTLAAGDYFYATLVSAANPSNFEVVKVTARTTDTFTITRAQESTAALAFVAGDTVQLRFTAQTFQDALNERLSADGAFKVAVRAATTANITLSGTQTIDGIAVVAGDRVLVKNQSTASANGIYVVAAGAWARASDADTAAKVAGMLVNVSSGTTNGGKLFETDFKSTDGLGSSSMTFNSLLDSAASIAASQIAGLNTGTTLTESGAIAADTIGFRSLPPVYPAAGAYTLTLTDAGKAIVVNGNVTIPANTSVAYPAGTTIVIVNATSTSVPITISTTDFLYIAALTAGQGTRTLQPFGIATLFKVNSNSWIATGAGLS